MLDERLTVAALIAGMDEEHCKRCPPQRVCAWACRQGMGVPDNAIAATLGPKLDWATDAEVEIVRQMLCDCYN